MILNDIKTTSKRQDGKNLDAIRVFMSQLDQSLFRYTQKISKIVSAIQLVANVMDNALPITANIRTQSLDLLSACYGVLSGAHATGPSDLTHILMRIEQVLSLVDIASVTHAMSPMNAEIIVTELAKIREPLAADIAELYQQEKQFIVHKPVKAQSIIPETMVQDQGFDDLIIQNDIKRHQNDIKTTLTTQNDTDENQNDNKRILNEFKTTNSVEVLHVDRQKVILNIIKSRQFSSSHDIKAMVPDYTDKMIQREIATLMNMGLVKREGNKRWAVYRAT